MTKKCIKCGEEKSLDKFEIHNNRLVGKPYHRNTCKTCINIKRKERRDNKESATVYVVEPTIKDMNRIRSRFTRLDKNINLTTDYSSITLEWYNKQLALQNNKCAICSKTPQELGRRLVVDHCHTTGKIRGLLCRVCNTSIGALGDNIEGLQKAINYLKQNE